MNDLPERQVEFLQAVAAGEPVVKNAATRLALVRRGLIEPTKSWTEIVITPAGHAALAEIGGGPEDPNYPASVVIEFRKGHGRSKTQHEIEVTIEWTEGSDGKPHGTVRVPSNEITLTKLYQGLTKRFRMRVVSPRTEDGVHVIKINPVKGWYATPGAAADVDAVNVVAGEEAEDEKTEVVADAPVERAA